MAPLPVPVPDAAPALNRLLSTISSLFKPRSPRQRASLGTSGEGIDSIEVKDRVIPSQLPADFELKPAGPEKQPWSKILDLQSADEYAESMSNPLSNKRKRSSTLSPSTAEVPIMLTHKTVQVQALLMMATDRAGIETPTQQQRMGKYSLTYPQELSFAMFSIFFIVFIGAAIIRAMVKIERQLRHYYMVHWCLALSFERRGICIRLHTVQSTQKPDDWQSCRTVKCCDCTQCSQRSWAPVGPGGGDCQEPLKEPDGKMRSGLVPETSEQSMLRMVNPTM